MNKKKLISLICIILAIVIISFVTYKVTKNIIENNNQQNNLNNTENTKNDSNTNIDNSNNSGTSDNLNNQDNIQQPNNTTNSNIVRTYYSYGYIAPMVIFSKNGNDNQTLIDSTKIYITGNYYVSSVKYYIDIQNCETPNAYSKNWTRYYYGDNIILSGISGKQYIWIKVKGTNGRTYTFCSKAFNIVNPIDNPQYIVPEISYSNDGCTQQMVEETTKINVSGDYFEESIKYYVDKQNKVIPISGWQEYTDAGVDIKNITGTVYVWTQIVGKDGKVYIKCSNGFNMIALKISFDKDGDAEQKLENITKVNVANEYNSIKYYIDTQNGNIPEVGWQEYTDAGVDIKNITGTVYIWARVEGKDGKIYTACSKGFNMLALKISFDKDGDAEQKLENITKINVANEYNSIKYYIDTQNENAPEVGWQEYTDAGVDIKNITGTVYVWAQVEGKDGKIYMACSKGFNMLTLKISFSDEKQYPDKNVEVNVKINVANEYNNIKYYIDTQNENAPEAGWQEYIDTGVDIKNITGTVYVWAQVEGKDEKFYTACTNSFNVVKEFETPNVLFSTNGDSHQSMSNFTKLTVSGDYKSNTTEYCISYSGSDTPQEGWIEYSDNDNIKICGITGTAYVWVKVIGRDGQPYVQHSNGFNMVSQPQIAIVDPCNFKPYGDPQPNINPDDDPYPGEGYDITISIKISTYNIKDIQYSFSMDGSKQDYTKLEDYDPSKGPQTVIIQKRFTNDQIGEAGKATVWFKITDIYGQEIECSTNSDVIII